MKNSIRELKEFSEKHALYYSKAVLGAVILFYFAKLFRK